MALRSGTHDDLPRRMGHVTRAQRVGRTGASGRPALGQSDDRKVRLNRFGPAEREPRGDSQGHGLATRAAVDALTGCRSTTTTRRIGFAA